MRVIYSCTVPDNKALGSKSSRPDSIITLEDMQLPRFIANPRIMSSLHP